MAAARRDLFCERLDQSFVSSVAKSHDRLSGPLGSPVIYFQTMLQGGHRWPKGEDEEAQRDGRKNAGLHENRGAMGIEPG
jgi:hypothetical protein